METMVHDSDRLGPRVTSVKALEDYQLLIAFTDGERRVFDVKPLLDMKVFRALQNRGLFDAVHVSHGSVAWPGDIDLCPDTLYAESMLASQDEQP